MAYIQHASSIDFGSATSISVALPNPVSAGNALYVFVCYFTNVAARDVTVTDSLGHSYSQASGGGFPLYDDPSDSGIAAFYVANTSTGSNTITASFTSGGSPAPAHSGCAIVVIEESNIDYSSPFLGSSVQANVAPGESANAITSGPTSLSSAPAVVYSVSFNTITANAPSAGNGTNVGTCWFDGGNAYGRIQRALVESTGNYASTFTAAVGAGVNTHFTMQLALAVASEAGTPGDASGAGAEATAIPAEGTADSISASLEFTGSGGFFDKDGSPVNAEGLTFYIWRASRPTGNPDQIITDVSIEDGELSLQIDFADLSNGDPVSWFVFDPDDENAAIFSAGVSQVSIG